MRDIIVKLLVIIGLYKPVVDLINRCKFEIQSRRMKKNGLKMLKEADQALDQIGVRAFLTYGVLLGAYREKTFISYDPDIDLGILNSEIPENMHEVMKNAGFQLYKQSFFKDSGQVFEETYIYEGIHLDMFYYFEEGDDLYSVIARNHEFKDWKEANVTDGFPCDRSYVPKTDFERREFLGLKIFMPVKTHEWLTDIYSDSYMTPVKNWNAKDYKTRIVKTGDRCYRKYCDVIVD